MEQELTQAIFGLGALVGTIGGGIIGKLAKGTVGRVAGGIIRKIIPGAKRAAQAVRTPTGQVVTAAAGGAVVSRAAAPVARTVVPPQVPVPAGRQTGGLQRAVQRVLPGGRTGLELTQIGEATDKIGRPMLVVPDVITRVYCPPGYVAVTLPDGQRACALKGPARSLGLWKGERKPPISAGDWHKLQVSQRVRARAKKIAQTAGFKTTTRGRSAAAPRRTATRKR